MMELEGIRGLIIPLPTVFKDDGSLDEGLIRAMADHYVSQGVSGLFLLGSYGQGPALEVQDRQKVAQIVLEEVQSRIPVVVHIGAVDPSIASILGEHARSAGADAVAVVAPYYYTDKSDEEIVLHFKVIDQAARLPMLLYNNPRYQGYDLSLSRARQLVREVPNIFGAKLAKGGIDDSLSWTESIPGFRTFCLISSLYPGMSMGIAGSISPPMAVAPALGVELVKAIDAGNSGRAFDLQTRATFFSHSLMRLGRAYGRGVQREALRAAGFPVARYPRWPTPPLPAEAVSAVQTLVEGLADDCADSDKGERGPEQ